MLCACIYRFMRVHHRQLHRSHAAQSTLATTPLARDSRMGGPPGRSCSRSRNCSCSRSRSRSRQTAATGKCGRVIQAEPCPEPRAHLRAQPQPQPTVAQPPVPGRPRPLRGTLRKVRRNLISCPPHATLFSYTYFQNARGFCVDSGLSGWGQVNFLTKV